GSRLAIAHPNKDDVFQDLSRVGAGVCTRLSPHDGVGTFAQDGDVAALAVEDPPVVRAGDGPVEMAIAFGQTSAAVRADIGERVYGAVALEDGEVFTEHADANGLLLRD